MILLIDVGNTRLKWRYLKLSGFFGGGYQVHQAGISSELLHHIWGSAEKPSAIWGVNVAGPLFAEQISQWTKARWGLVPNFVTSSRHLGNVTNGYSEPEKLGADRWMALVGTDRIVQGACCVVDCGSAVTVDCLNAAHEHIGGLILPGLTMMSRCVSDNTALVAFKAVEAAWLGRDTASCLASGAMQSIVATLQRMATLLEIDCSSPVTRIITGGDAQQLLPWLGEAWRYEPDLIFTGLVAALQHEG